MTVQKVYMDHSRVPVQATRAFAKPAGTIEWSEHKAAWEAYAKLHGADPSAERIAERGGFSYGQLVDYLNGEPKTWRTRAGTMGR